MIKASEILEAGAKTYRDRNAVYGDNYLKVGEVMAALFPDGITLKTADDHNRFHIFALMIVKQTRYVTSWETGGHMDSIHDNTVYSAMLEEIDQNIAARDAPSLERYTEGNPDPHYRVPNGVLISELPNASRNGFPEPDPIPDYEPRLPFDAPIYDSGRRVPRYEAPPVYNPDERMLPVPPMPPVIEDEEDGA